MKGLMRIDWLPTAPLIKWIAQFFLWWRDELVALMPKWLRQHLQYNEHQLVVSVGNDSVEVVDCRHGHIESSLNLIPAADDMLDMKDQAKLSLMCKRWGSGVVVKLPRDHVLSFSFPLPLEAENNLHEVVGYELGRHAPFKVDQIYYDYVVSDRRKDERNIWLSVMAVPRKQVDPLLERVRGWGMTPETLAVAAEEGESDKYCKLMRFNLLPQSKHISALGSMDMLTRLLAITAVLLVIAVAGYPLLMQKLHLADMRTQLEEVKKDAAGVLSLKQQMERAAEESAYVDEQKQQHPEVLDVLKALTNILPDDTWLEQVELRGSRVRMNGLSADASSLIERLENSPLLQNVTFDSPIVKDRRTDRFRFQIVAELTTQGGE